MRLIDFLEFEYFPARLIGKSGNSMRQYRLSVQALGRVLGRDPTLADLTDRNIGLLMQARLEGKIFRGRSRGTANKDRCQLLALWRFALHQGYVTKGPCVAQLTEPERIPRAWTIDELQKQFHTIRSLDGDVAGVPKSLWWESLVRVALDTAERIGAIFSARWDWLEGRWITVPAEVRKGSRRDRRYLLSEATSEMLQALRNCRADRTQIFPWDKSANLLWRDYGIILRQAGLPSGRGDKFHRLRKTTASVLYAAGLNAQEALDHQHRRTTQRYIDPRFTHQTHASEVLARFLANPKRKPPENRDTA